MHLKIKELMVTERGYRYRTFLVEGKGQHGERIRKKFKDRNDALAFKNETEIEIENSDLKVRRTITRLSNESIRDAELALAKLTGRATLLRAAEYFVQNFREPSTANLLSTAVEAFLLERVKPRSTFYVRPRSMKQCRSVWNQFKAFISTYHGGDIPVHEITRAMISGFLERTDNPKTFSNWHSELKRFFEFCLDPDRVWATQNPLTSISRPRISATRIPEVLSLKRVQEIMRFVATFPGSSKRKPGVPGQLAPYFALALFAGIRTDDDGELMKIARSPDAADKILDLRTKNIRIPPHISKTGQFRAVKIRPCLEAWLSTYSGPILPTNHDKDIAYVRKKFAIGRDVLRHTWYSMKVIAFRSVAEAALEGGSTESVVHSHYLNMAQHTEEEAHAFWKIMPPQPS